jgi:hypothetical protein
MTEITFYITMFLMLLANSLLIFGINKATEYTEEERNVPFGEQISAQDDIALPPCTKKETIITDKMALWFVRHYSIKWFGVFWSKPLMLCPPCMSSVWGTIFFATQMPLTLHSLVIFIFYVPILAGINTLLQRFIL